MNKKFSFKIKNFRNIIDASIDIWPDKINFIVGDNNIGKSNMVYLYFKGTSIKEQIFLIESTVNP